MVFDLYLCIFIFRHFVELAYSYYTWVGITYQRYFRFKNTCYCKPAVDTNTYVFRCDLCGKDDARNLSYIRKRIFFVLSSIFFAFSPFRHSAFFPVPHRLQCTLYRLPYQRFNLTQNLLKRNYFSHFVFITHFIFE